MEETSMPEAQEVSRRRLLQGFTATGNLTFGGPKNNRLYMASCHSLYAFYVESHGAV
jgi:sugar lactone lactonase YvrE